MFSHTLKKFKSLPKETRSMVYLFWVWNCAETLVGIFLSIFVFMQTESLITLVQYNLIFFLGVFLGFCVWGYITSMAQLSMRLNYFKAFLVYICSFLMLIFLEHSVTNLMLFGLINGTGLGMFWVGVHSYEMLYTKDENRDFYSSMTSAGSQALTVIGPLIATITFYISEKVLEVETFTLLFTMLPFVYLASLPVLFSLPDYTPKKIETKEIKRLFFDKKITPARRYFFFSGLDWASWATIFPIIAIQSMGTVINVGIVETATGVLSIIAVLFLADKRHSDNRLQIYFYCLIWGSIAFGFAAFWEKSPIFFLIYTIMIVLIDPIWRVSEHVIDLKSVEIIKEKEDASFYAGLLYRDFVLWVGRVCAILVIGLYGYLFGTSTGLKLGILSYILALFLLYFSAKQMLKHDKLPKTGFMGDEDQRSH